MVSELVIFSGSNLARGMNIAPLSFPPFELIVRGSSGLLLNNQLITATIPLHGNNGSSSLLTIPRTITLPHCTLFE